MTNTTKNPVNYMQKTLLRGNVIGLGVGIFGSILIVLMRDIDFFRTYIPVSVSSNWWVFFIIVIGDGGVAGNRWSRFVFQAGRSSVTFLLVRIALKLLFAAGLLLTDTAGGYSVAVMFIIIWLLEYGYIALRTRGLDRLDVVQTQERSCL